PQRGRPRARAPARYGTQPGVRDRALSGRGAERRERLIALILSLVLLLATPAVGGPAGTGPGARAETRAVRAERALPIAQLQYGGGGDWYANPSSLPNLLNEVRKRTGLPVADRPAQVKLTDAALWTHPYIYITGHGNIRLTDEEVGLLRRYLLSGGFLH